MTWKRLLLTIYVNLDSQCENIDGQICRNSPGIRIRTDVD